MTAARRNLLQHYRHAQVERDPTITVLLADHGTEAPPAVDIPDERLKLMFACAHPAIDASVRCALMMQTVLGIEADKIAAAFLVSPSAMAQRLVRAKAKIRLAGIRLEQPEARDLPERLHNVLEAIYAAFGLAWDDQEGGELASEAIYLADLVASLLPDQPEAAGLLALLLFSDSRRAARYRNQGGQRVFIPLNAHDTGLWNKPGIDQANQILWHAAGFRQPGPFQLEAAIQSAHCHRMYTGRTPWVSIAQLYEQLLQISPTLGAAVGHAVALGESQGPAAALAALESLRQDPDTSQEVTNYAPFWAALAHWQDQFGDAVSAAASYTAALGLHRGEAERDYLTERIHSLHFP
jgi:RNA polymerase sigma-70 factor (ECF subfamily)